MTILVFLLISIQHECTAIHVLWQQYSFRENQTKWTLKDYKVIYMFEGYMFFVSSFILDLLRFLFFCSSCFMIR